MNVDIPAETYADYLASMQNSEQKLIDELQID